MIMKKKCEMNFYVNIKYIFENDKKNMDSLSLHKSIMDVLNFISDIIKMPNMRKYKDLYEEAYTNYDMLYRRDKESPFKRGELYYDMYKEYLDDFDIQGYYNYMIENPLQLSLTEHRKATSNIRDFISFVNDLDEDNYKKLISLYNICLNYFR